MAEDIVRKSGTSSVYSNDAGNAVLITEPVIGIVKNNIDAAHSGRIDVYVAKYGGSDPDNSDNWIKNVRYLSPFFGNVSPNYDPYAGPDKTGYGAYVGNPHSYGFWASAPDIGTEVICIFVDGRPNQGYYIGCVPKMGLHHMVPGVGASDKFVPNAKEADSYGRPEGVTTRLPVTEVNYANPALQTSAQIYAEPKPVHSYQAAVLAYQGLIRDDIRGTISSSSQRETPSKVFGFSTPGGPIYSGGYTDFNIASALDADPSKLQVIGRRGGHSLVMDDGTFTGEDQLVRLRSSAGHQILMSDSGQTLFIIHSNGQSWIELGKEGTIDMYASNSVNIRTTGDLNLHADRDVNINAKRNLHMFGENIKVEAEKNITHRSGENFQAYHVGTYSLKVDGAMSALSGGDASYASGATTYINGSSYIKLNSGAASLTPGKVAEITKINHTDTTYSESKGWMYPSPNPLLSITSRATTHQPFAAANKGVDVTVNQVTSSSLPTPTPPVQAANINSPQTPQNPAPVATIATAFGSGTSVRIAGMTVMDPATVAAVTVQNAVTNANLTLAQKVEQGIIPESGITLKMAEQAGAAAIVKPGVAEYAIAKMTAQGVPLSVATATTNFTNAFGVKSLSDLATNKDAQIAVALSTLQAAATDLHAKGLITGKESATQISGVVNAVSQYGTATVANATNIVTNTASAGAAAATVANVKNAIAGGNFAANTVDNLKGGITAAAGKIASGLSSFGSNLATNLNSFASGATKTLASLSAQLQDVAKKTYALVEQSFKRLKAGVPNSSSGTAVVSALSASASTNNAVANSNVNTLTNGLNTISDSIKQGAGNLLNNLKEVSTKVGAAFGVDTNLSQKLDNVKQLGGNLVSNLGNNLSSLAGTAADLAKNTGSQLGTKLKDTIGSLTANLKNLTTAIGGEGVIKSATPVENTFDKAAIETTTAQLLGDNRIPVPIFGSVPNIIKINAEKYLAQQSALLAKIKQAQSDREIEAIELSNLIDQYSSTQNVQYLSEIGKMQTKLAQTDLKIQKLQEEYQKLITPTSLPTNDNRQ